MAGGTLKVQLHELQLGRRRDGSTVTLDTRLSKVLLPIVGGYGVAVASGGFAGS